jgi:tetratricopeptide (TPR) repeat protein
MVEAQLNLGIVAFLQGRLENARDHAQSALRKSQDLHLKSDQAISLMQLGDVLLAENDLKEASKYYQEALDLRTQLGEKGTIAATNVSRAALSLEENRAPAAEALAQQASEEFRTENSPGQELAARDVLAQALLAQGKVKDASTEVNQAAQLTVTDLSTQLSFEITRGRVSARAGNPADGLAKIVAAGERAKQIGMIPYALQARLAAAEIQIAQCDAARARTDLTSLHSEASRLKYNLIASKAQAVAKPAR